MSTQLADKWSLYNPVQKEDLEILKKASKGFTGIQYKPITVSKLTDTEFRYKFNCTASLPPSEISWKVIVEIYMPINGNPIITEITRI